MVIWQVPNISSKTFENVAIEMIEKLLTHSFGSTWNVLKFLHGRRIN